MADFTNININGELAINCKDAYARERLSRNGKRRFILIGDSFSAGIISTTKKGKGWAEHFADYVAGWADVYYTTAILAGVSGFASSLPFLTMLQSIDIEEKDTITDIVVLGGNNDLNLSNLVENKMIEFIQYCHDTFPNALVKIGCLGTRIEQLYSTLHPIYSKCVEHGCVYIKDTLCLMCDPTLISDGTHLTQAGYDLYDPYITEAILTGFTQYHFTFSRALTESILNNYARISFTVTEKGYGATYTRIDGLHKTEYFPFDATSNNDMRITIGKIENIPRLPYYYARLFPCPVLDVSNNIASYCRVLTPYIADDGLLYGAINPSHYPTQGKTLYATLMQTETFNYI